MFRGLRIPVILLAFVGSLGVALALQNVLYGAQVTSPLVSELEAFGGVAAVELQSEQGETTVVITVDEPIDLAAEYPDWHRVAERRLGSGFGGIRLVDTRDERLTEAYYRLHFGIAEAVMTGEFRELNREAERIVEEMGLTAYRLQVDSDRIYVQLELDDMRLYEVIERPAFGTHAERRGIG